MVEVGPSVRGRGGCSPPNPPCDTVDDNSYAEHELHGEEDPEGNRVADKPGLSLHVTSEQARGFGESPFVLEEAWHCQLEQALTAHVDQGEHDRQGRDEATDENKDGTVRGLLDGREHAPVGEDREHNEEIEGLEALLCIEREVMPEIVAFFGVHQWALTYDMSSGRRQAKLLGGRLLDGGIGGHATH